ncbi:unnamed protein product [Zymoseptoria tritici ST99CH_1A5]|uniref:MARVEL domain-containing protein n=4 Tax=Zymoseptoria tritici TaxID=1047171 RepID=F9WY23_ZYMTI|nr:uncharacterized protein MYCGRDRAFT_66368 [Zymoseptoria tritici IPO323]SMQ46059.1 unnamed protein product [Zymoseptoria tritici ST99CH_3D7]SMR42405.1 unnamed protein product [Zymoseptoria tritici ST99CH_1E4]SMR44582.1 unnamed protein product [Zymoseptoria tritici ST99CH_3D1]SMY19744.1 unnamed protein product [Zymoseptoria tritici ST99CH_1A5]EGP92268.1 hypothetical protein MYCGRDRAFT_66368 [Zymoseptoria tritici IPO323]
MRVFFAFLWRKPKVMIGLLAFELVATVACLVLMGIAHPNTYRTKLWQNGFDKGFNSSPSSILYDYANWRPAHIPLIWSSYGTTFNVVISLLSLFILLVKSSLYVMHVFIPAASVLLHAALFSLYCVSIYNQSRPDLSDLEHRINGLPWYLSKGCSYATPGNKGYCLQARGTFAVTVIMAALYAVFVGYSIWSAIPTEAEKVVRDADHQSDLEMKKISMYGMDGDMSKEERREMNRQLFLNLPKTPNTPGFGVHNPMTPRTTAFTQLNGGEAPSGYHGRATGPNAPLPFRENYGNVPDAR